MSGPRRTTAHLIVVELAAMEDRLGELAQLAPLTGYTSLVRSLKSLQSQVKQQRQAVIRKRDALDS